MKDKIIGLYPMAADILHTGHYLAIEEASHNCDYLIVALNCKPDGKNPVQSIYERYMQLRGVKFIDEVIPYEGKKDLEKIAASLRYEVRFLGEEYKELDWDGKTIERNLNKSFYFLPRQHAFSSTNLKARVVEKLKEQNEPS